MSFFFFQPCLGVRSDVSKYYREKINMQLKLHHMFSWQLNVCCINFMLLPDGGWAQIQQSLGQRIIQSSTPSFAMSQFVSSVQTQLRNYH